MVKRTLTNLLCTKQNKAENPPNIVPIAFSNHFSVVFFLDINLIDTAAGSAAKCQTPKQINCMTNYISIIGNRYKTYNLILNIFFPFNFCSSLMNVRWKNMRSRMKVPFNIKLAFRKCKNSHCAHGCDLPITMATTPYSRIRVRNYDCN